MTNRLLIVGLVLTSCSSMQARKPSSESRATDVGRTLGALVDEAKAPGAIVFVAAPGFRFSEARGVFEKKSGRPLRDTDLVRIASISKTYFGALAAILSVEGKIDLRAPLSRTFPDVAQRFTPRSDPDGRLRDPGKLTIEQMLGHRAGIADPLKPDDSFLPYYAKQLAERKPLEASAALDDIFQNGLLFQPWDGSGPPRFEYSNGGYILAANLVERVMGRPYDKLIREKILDPLGLKNTFNGSSEAVDLDRLAHGYRHLEIPGTSSVVDDWQNVDQGNGLANGGMVASVQDVASFYRALFRDSSFPKGESRDAFLRAMLPTREATPELNGTWYANGLMLDRDGCYSHAGHFSGYIGSALYCPEQDLVVVIEVTTDEDPLPARKEAELCRLKKLFLPQAHCGGVGG